jgi:O-antigen ligase
VSAVLTKERWWFGLAAALFIVLTVTAIYVDQYLLIALPFALLFFYAGWQYQNFIFHLLLFALPFSFEYQFSSSLGTDLPDEFLMLFVSFLFFGGWMFKPALLGKRTLFHPLLIILVIWLLWIAVTVCFSTHTLVSVKFLLAKSWYIGAFVLAPILLFTKQKKIVTAALVLVSAMFIVTLISLFRHSQTDFRFASINDVVAPFFRNHVNYSAMLVCLLPIGFAFYYHTSNKKNKVVIATCIVLGLVAVYFSYARGAWVAVIIAAGAWWLTSKKLLLIAFFISVIATVAALSWLKKDDRYLLYAHDYQTTIFHKDFGEHLVATYKLKDVSTAERFYRWIAGVRMIKDNWLTGYGPNTFYEHYKGYAVPAYKTWVSDNKDRSTVHNYFLLTAIEQGIPGLIFFLLLLAAALWYAQQLYHKISDRFYRTVAMVVAVMLSMIITLNFLSDLIETDKIGSLFFLSIAMLVVTDRNAAQIPGMPKKATVV